MRFPHLYDFVYINKYEKSLFQVIGINHLPVDKYATYQLINVGTFRDEVISCSIFCRIEEIYGVPFSDIEFHFHYIDSWDFWQTDEGEDIEDHVIFCDYDFTIKDGKWYFDMGIMDPEPTDIKHFHELQQYHRGMYGEELDLFKGFKKIKP